MKTLLIMRHAKSDYPADVHDDFDRPLNERGRKDLPRGWRQPWHCRPKPCTSTTRSTWRHPRPWPSRRRPFPIAPKPAC